MPTTIKLNADGDLDIRGGLGPAVVSGTDAVGTYLIARFSTNAGEWGYNLEFGLPYNDAILGRYFEDAVASGIYASTASACPGVLPVPFTAVSFSIDPDTRKLSAVVSPIYLAGTTEAITFAS